MVRQLGAVHPAKAGRMRQSRLGQGYGGRLDRELVALFGKELVAQSESMSLEAMAVEAELVAEGARQLREHTGQPEAQRCIVRGMAEETALALCKWIKEAGKSRGQELQLGCEV